MFLIVVDDAGYGSPPLFVHRPSSDPYCLLAETLLAHKENIPELALFKSSTLRL